MNDAIHRRIKDQQVDAELRRFLDLRAADVGGMPTADETVRALERRLDTSTTRRPRALWRPQWRPGPMDVTRDVPGVGDSDRRSRSMLTTITAATAALVLVLGGALSVVRPSDPEDVPPAASTEPTFVVAQDGSGTHTSIDDAVAEATAGDVIHVRPGTYEVALEITTDVTLEGDGPVDEIVLRRQDSGPIIQLTDSDATLAGFTLTGASSWLDIDGGSPTLDGLVMDGLGEPRWLGAHSLHIDGGTTRVSGNLFTRSGPVSVIGSASPIVERNEFRDGHVMLLTDLGDDAILRGNHFVGAFDSALSIKSGGTFLIEDNEFLDNLIGIDIGNSEAIIRGNTLRGQSAEGVVITGLANPRLEGNTIEGNGVGVVIEAHRAPTLVGNRICDNGVDLEVNDTARPEMSGNTICTELARG